MTRRGLDPADLPEGTQGPTPADRWFPELYEELRSIADRRLARERRDHTLSATALVHEAYLKLFSREREWISPEQFYAAASKAMREILCDHARARAALRRGGGVRPITLVETRTIDPTSSPTWDLLDLESGLDALARVDRRKAHGVELRLFGGLDAVEIAKIQGVSRRTAEADWFLSREWLGRYLRGERP